LSYDVVDIGVGHDGRPLYTFGFVIEALAMYGVNLPSDEIIKRQLEVWAKDMGYEIQWEALPVRKEKRRGVAKEHSESTGRAASPITQFAARW
jgi:hypothetical protein